MADAMSEEDLQGLVGIMVDQAVSYVDTEVGPQRALASSYYRGDLFGDEEEGRSQVVSRDVRDTVQQMMPPLMRIFWGGQNVVEFLAQGPEDVPAAEQATDYVNYVIKQDNPGFELFYQAFKDALVRKTGIWKVWYDTSERVKTSRFSGIDEQTFAVMAAEEGVEVQSLSQRPDGSLDVVMKRTITEGRVKVAIVPPEELLLNRNARTAEGAILIGHRCLKTRSDLVAMGYDREEIDALPDNTSDLLTREEVIARRPFTVFEDDDRPNSTQEVTYYELYVRVDYDGDGIAELRRVCCAGSNYTILANDEWDCPPFAVIRPDPEFYSLVEGDSVADLTMDIQRIKSTLMRNALDNLYLSNFPRMGAVEGAVEMDDLLNNEIGGVVRMKRPDAVVPLTVPFTAAASMPMIEFIDTVKEQRTGVTKAAIGLDANALQSTTQIAAAATVTASRERVELIAHIFAETGVKQLYKLILQLICKHQDRERVIRLRNQYVAVDPRGWSPDMDMTVNVGLGGGTDEQKIGVLAQVSQKQEQILQLMGPNNPLVTLQGYHRTLTRMLELSGIKDADQYFSDPAQFVPPPPEPPPPDPALMIAQVEAQKAKDKAEAEYRDAQLRAQTEAAKLAQDREQFEKTQALEWEKLRLEWARLGQKDASDARRSELPQVATP